MISTEKHLRPIRSYVRREGRMTPGQERGFETYWADYGLELSAGPLEGAFAKAGDCVLEIGFGMGASLLEQAAAHPEVNFLGIEVHRPGVGKLLLEAGKLGLTNLLIYSHDAKEVLAQAIAAESLTRVQVFFPDPWPKTRHHKRRLLSPEFVEVLQSKLKPGGVLHIATDWENYATVVRKFMQDLPSWVALDDAQERAFRPETKFERRGIKLA